ncbi:MAG TPA: aminotransferase class V-fold PLP-dependent enzyme [Candidatus Omnitrophota bacterium]|nr:aminotransferase class V-fold PLP-dependent enzyme [Candidatus Omnitrophota bacterium]
MIKRDFSDLLRRGDKTDAGLCRRAGALGLQGIAAHEQSLTDYAIQSLKSLEALRLIGNAKKRAAVISFVLEGLHPHDISTILNSEGVAVRAGHHCAQPVMDFYKISGSVRASFALYNTIEDIDALLAGLRKAGRVFR